jgi:hypothetical protein
MFTAVLTIAGFIAGLAIGRWFYPSEAAVMQRRDALLRERERPEHDHERARQIAEIQSEVSKVTGWAPTGW